MTARRGIAIASAAVATAVAVFLSTSALAETAAQGRDRPRGVVEGCWSISGFGESRRDFRLRQNLVVGPLALRHAGVMLPWWKTGQKLFVEVKGGHRVTLELSRRTRRDAGLGFVPPRDPFQWTVSSARRVVTFIACQRGEKPATDIPDAWPVTGWVGSLNARSPRCVPLLVWVDDEPTPRHAVIPYGVSDCG